MKLHLSAAQLEAMTYVAELQNDAAITHQMSHVDYFSGTATMAQVALRDDSSITPSGLPDGPAPSAAAVLGEDGELAGELLLWIQNGIVDVVEQTWYTELPPTALPNRDQVTSYVELAD